MIKMKTEAHTMRVFVGDTEVLERTGIRCYGTGSGQGEKNGEKKEVGGGHG